MSGSVLVILTPLIENDRHAVYKSPDITRYKRDSRQDTRMKPRFQDGTGKQTLMVVITLILASKLHSFVIIFKGKLILAGENTFMGLISSCWNLKKTLHQSIQLPTLACLRMEQKHPKFVRSLGLYYIKSWLI